MTRLFLILGSASAGLAVAAGALGAHLLRGRLEPRMLDVFETAARYQMYHALALLITAWLVARSPGRAGNAAGLLFLLGTLLFSGSLYLLSLGGPTTLGMVTPLGGLAFLGGWTSLAIAAARSPGK